MRESAANPAAEREIARARDLAMKGDGEAATKAYLATLLIDPAHPAALVELGTLALSRGFRSAARRAYREAIRRHPGDAVARVNLGNVLVDDLQYEDARDAFLAALEIDRDLPEAHQGLGRARAALGDARAAESWRRGFAGDARLEQPARGVGAAIPALVLASVQLGNMPTRPWLDESLFARTVVHVEFWDDSAPLPPHALIVNAIGDADLCRADLARAEALLARSAAPVINPPDRVRATGRVDNARRLGALPGVIAPEIAMLPRTSITAARTRDFPRLLRAPGFHTGQHFVRVDAPEALADALAALPGDEVLSMSFLDARRADGLTRKYRAMFIGGEIYPLHLAISADWKVHYFSAAMADHPEHREEERRFLDDMEGAIGARATRALRAIERELGLDYCGVDFGLAPDGALLLFEANATMVVISPPPEPIWDYRRRAVADVLAAAKTMALTRALRGVR